MKKALVISALGLMLALAGILAFAKSIALDLTVSALNKQGFKTVEAGDLSLGLNGIKFGTISMSDMADSPLGTMGYTQINVFDAAFALDGGNISKIIAIKNGETNDSIEHIALNYKAFPAFKLNKIDIKTVKYSHAPTDKTTTSGPSTPLTLPEINVGALDITAFDQSLQLANLSFTDNALNAEIVSDKNGLDITSKLSGTIKSTDDYDLTWTLETLKADMLTPLPLNLKRGTGWLNIKSPAEVGALPKITGEITTGSLTIAGVALNAVTAHLSSPEAGTYDILAEGYDAQKTTRLNANAQITPNGERLVSGQIDLVSDDLAATQAMIEGQDAVFSAGTLNVKSNFDIRPADTGLKGGFGAKIKLDKGTLGEFTNIKTEADITYDIETSQLSAQTTQLSSEQIKIKNIDISGNYGQNLILKAAWSDALSFDGTLKDDTLSYTVKANRDLKAKDVNTLLNPFADVSLEKFKGRPAVRGRLNVKQGIGSHKIKLENIDIETDVVGAQKINGVISMTQTPTNIQLSDEKLYIGALRVGSLPLTNGLLTMGFEGKTKTLRIIDMSWDMAGGKITAAPYTLRTDNWDTDMTLQAENINLEELFKLAPMQGLSAQGRVSGKLPVSIKDGVMTISGANLSSIENGLLKYDPENPPSFLQGENEQIKILRGALENYQFETLSLTLNGATNADQTITLQAMGNNPDLFDGRPVKLNLNLEGPLDNLIEFNLGALKIPDTIQKNLNAFGIQ